MSVVNSLCIRSLYMDSAKYFYSWFSLICSIGYDEMQGITGSYSSCPLEVISMAENRLGDDGFSVFSYILGDLKNLKEVYLQNNNITEDARSEIIQFIRNSFY